MSTIWDSRASRHSAATGLRIAALVARWTAYLERRQREKLRAALSGLGDRELTDIGVTRAEIDSLASRRAIDPKNVRSVEWLRHLPTVDGQVRPFWPHLHPGDT